MRTPAACVAAVFGGGAAFWTRPSRRRRQEAPVSGPATDAPAPPKEQDEVRLGSSVAPRLQTAAGPIGSFMSGPPRNGSFDMKKLLLSSVALIGLTAGTMAADLPPRAAPPPPVFAAPVPIFSWTGFYIGANAGYGFSDNDDDVFNSGFGGFGSNLTVPAAGGGVFAVTPAAGGFFNGFNRFDDRRSRDGFVGGGQIGFNYQLTPGSGFVIGIEADIQFADFGGNRDEGFFGFGNEFGNAVPGGTAANVAGVGIAPVGFSNAPGFGGPAAPGNVAFFNNAFNNGVGGRGGSDWFGTVRGRLGYAFDRVMVYATGGLAFTDDNRRDDNIFGFGGFTSGAALGPSFFTGPGAAAAGAQVAPTFVGFSRRNNDNWGWTVGGGVEYAFTNNISLKLEGLYVNFDRDHNNNGFFGGEVVGVSNTGAPITRTNLGLVNNNDNNDFFVVRAGINFRF